ncbi:MAG: hypothetical protein Q9160_002117 [Pyrenula sp. 1 TL-2023]
MDMRGDQEEALVRHGSQYTHPVSSITTVSVDFASASDLAPTLIRLEADALLICIPGGAVKFASQKLLIDAAIVARVRLIVPSEYVADIMSEQYGRFPDAVVGEKRQVRHYLEENLGEDDQGSRSETKWVSVNGGPFWDMWFPKFFDLENRKATIYGPGTNPTCWTTRATVARAILHLLTHYNPEDPYHLLNRPHFIAGVTPPLTMNAVVSALETQSANLGESGNWVVEQLPMEPIREEASKALERGDHRAALRNLTLLSQFDAEGWQGRAADFSRKGLSNEMLGVESVDVEAMVRNELEKNWASRNRRGWRLL